TGNRAAGMAIFDETGTIANQASDLGTPSAGDASGRETADDLSGVDADQTANFGARLFSVYGTARKAIQYAAFVVPSERADFHILSAFHRRAGKSDIANDPNLADPLNQARKIKTWWVRQPDR